MSEPAQAPAQAPAPAAEPPPFPSRGWALLGVAAVLGGAALVISRLWETAPALLATAGTAALGFAVASHAYGLARASHRRMPLMACGLLLGFLAIPLFGAVVLGVLSLLSAR